MDMTHKPYDRYCAYPRRVSVFLRHWYGASLCLHQELQKKREDKRNEIKRKAEEEVKYLQASGKVTKTPSNTSLGARRKTTGYKNATGTSRSDQRSEGETPRSVDQEAAAGAVGGVSPSLNDVLQVSLISHNFVRNAREEVLGSKKKCVLMAQQVEKCCFIMMGAGVCEKQTASFAGWNMSGSCWISGLMQIKILGWSVWK